MTIRGTQLSVRASILLVLANHGRLGSTAPCSAVHARETDHDEACRHHRVRDAQARATWRHALEQPHDGHGARDDPAHLASTWVAAASVTRFELSKDLRFVDKLPDVVGLYLNPPDQTVVFCVDEMNGMLAVDLTRPVLPLLRKVPEQQIRDYIRHGTMCNC
jgi:hypothetical protein